MMEPSFAFLIVVAISGGVLFGSWSEARRWRAKGDHEHVNRMLSGGALYQVKREAE